MTVDSLLELVQYNSCVWTLARARFRGQQQGGFQHYDTLQNLSAAREKLDVTVDLIVKIDNYIFFTNSDDLNCSGLVTSVTNDDILVLRTTPAHS